GAAVLRLAAARGNLWLDEIWTLYLLGTIEAPLQIVTTLTHDNNHILNSCCAWWLRGGADAALRVPAVVAGTLGVAVAAAFAGLRDDPRAQEPSRTEVRATLAALLQATSCLMVHYQS